MYVCSRVMMQWSVMYSRRRLCYPSAYLYEFCVYGWYMIKGPWYIVRAPLLQNVKDLHACTRAHLDQVPIHYIV